MSRTSSPPAYNFLSDMPVELPLPVEEQPGPPAYEDQSLLYNGRRVAVQHGCNNLNTYVCNLLAISAGALGAWGTGSVLFREKTDLPAVGLYFVTAGLIGSIALIVIGTIRITNECCKDVCFDEVDADV